MPVVSLIVEPLENAEASSVLPGPLPTKRSPAEEPPGAMKVVSPDDGPSNSVMLAKVSLPPPPGSPLTVPGVVAALTVGVGVGDWQPVSGTDSTVARPPPVNDSPPKQAARNLVGEATVAW